MNNMELHTESTYEPLKGQTNQFDTTEDTDTESEVPRDRYNILYLVLISIGIGFALPYYSFIMASEYWQTRYTGYSVAMDMLMNYTVVTVSTVLLNILFLSMYSYKSRIIFGYIISFISLVIVFCSELVWYFFDIQTSYSIISVACALSSIGCAIQQASYFGYASIFPKKYIQAVLIGEGLAGFLAAIAYVLIKFTANSAIWTVIFFSTPTIFIVFSAVLYAKHIHIHSPFVHYYVKTTAPIESHSNRRLNELQNRSNTKWTIVRIVYPFMVCIALTNFVTASIHPRIEAEIISCNLKELMPISLMLMFTASDVIAKVMALIPYTWSKRQLILLATLRSCLLVLLLLCCTPRSQPIIAYEIPAFIFTIALGASNGLSASLSMIQASHEVSPPLREATGNIMTFAYKIGVTAGLFMCFVFDEMRGMQTIDPCPKFTFITANGTANI